MAKKQMEFTDFKKGCSSRTYQDNKCVNEKNKSYRMVDGCQEQVCPTFKNSENAPPEAPKPEETKQAPATSDAPKSGTPGASEASKKSGE